LAHDFYYCVLVLFDGLEERLRVVSERVLELLGLDELNGIRNFGRLNNLRVLGLHVSVKNILFHGIIE
jgi:hypothetical protein